MPLGPAFGSAAAAFFADHWVVGSFVDLIGLVLAEASPLAFLCGSFEALTGELPVTPSL